MTVDIRPLDNQAAKSALCAKLSDELPMWFGRPEANAMYMRGLATRDVYAAFVDGSPEGLIALEYHFGVTCNVWWLGVSPRLHRHGIGRPLMARACIEARKCGCRQMVLETMSPRAKSAVYDQTRLFYEALGFMPLVEFEPEPGDFMMWMLRAL